MYIHILNTKPKLLLTVDMDSATTPTHDEEDDVLNDDMPTQDIEEVGLHSTGYST